MRGNTSQLSERDTDRLAFIDQVKDSHLSGQAKAMVIRMSMVPHSSAPNDARDVFDRMTAERE